CGTLSRWQRPFKAVAGVRIPLGAPLATRYTGGDFGPAPTPNDNSFDNSSQIVSDNSSSLYAGELLVSRQYTVGGPADSENRRRRAWYLWRLDAGVEPPSPPSALLTI